MDVAHFGDADEEDVALLFLHDEATLLATTGVAASPWRCACRGGDGDTKIDDDDGGVISCGRCGVVVDRVLDEKPEWRNGAGASFLTTTTSSTTSRVGMPSTSNVLGVNTLGTATPQRLPRAMQIVAARCHALSYRDRSLLAAAETIGRRCEQAGLLPRVASEAIALFRAASACPSAKKTRRANLMAACVQEAGARSGATRSAREIAQLFDISVSSLSLGGKHFRAALVVDAGARDLHARVPSPDDFVARFASRLGMTKPEAMRARELAERVVAAPELNRVAAAHAPQSVAAACIGLCVREARKCDDVRHVAAACDVSIATLQKVISALEIAGNASFIP